MTVTTLVEIRRTKRIISGAFWRAMQAHPDVATAFHGMLQDKALALYVRDFGTAEHPEQVYRAETPRLVKIDQDATTDTVTALYHIHIERVEKTP